MQDQKELLDNSKSPNLNSVFDEAKKALYIKIFLIFFVIVIIVLFVLFLLNKNNTTQNTNNTAFPNIDSSDREIKTNNTESNTEKEETVDDETGLWNYYNILSDSNIIVADKFTDGVIYVERNFLGNSETVGTKQNNKYTLYILNKKNKTNHISNIKLPTQDIINSISINNSFDHIFIITDKSSYLYKINQTTNNEETNYFLDNLGEITNVKKSTMTNNYLYFVRLGVLYKIDFKTLKETKILNIPINYYDLKSVSDEIYLITKTNTKSIQTILKLNEDQKMFNLYSSSYEEEYILADAKLKKEKNLIVLQYGYNNNINTNLNTTVNKCTAGSGYLFCGYSTGFNTLNNWLNKSDTFSDNIKIYDLETKREFVLNIQEDIKMNIDIDNIFIYNNFLYFKDRNTGAFVELDLDILKKLNQN